MFTLPIGFQQLLGTIHNQVWVVLVSIRLDYSSILLPICTEYFTNEEAIRAYYFFHFA